MPSVIAVTQARQTRRGVAMVRSLPYLFGSLKERSAGWLPRENPSDGKLLDAHNAGQAGYTQLFRGSQLAQLRASSGIRIQAYAEDGDPQRRRHLLRPG